MNDPEPHLLVVDDDVRLRELLRRYLSDNGFRVTAAANAAEARARLASFAFDLMVLDVMMPGENGLDLQQVLVAQGHNIPIIFITGHGDIAMAVRAMKMGAVDFLSKPFDDQALLDAVQQALRLKR